MVVVTCTNGEFGDAPGGIKPGQDGHDPEAVARLRLAELDESAQHPQGQRRWRRSATTTRGWRSGTTRHGPTPSATCRSTTVAGRIGELITKYRPQVLVTYDDAGAYQHPDHVHASRAAQAAAAATGHPREGVPVHDEGLQLAEDLGRAARGGRGGAELGQRLRRRRKERAQRALESEARITTTVDIRPVLDAQAGGAVRARQPDQRLVVQQDARRRSRSRRSATSTSSGSTDTTGAPLPEDDLFAGLRTGA